MKGAGGGSRTRIRQAASLLLDSDRMAARLRIFGSLMVLSYPGMYDLGAV